MASQGSGKKPTTADLGDNGDQEDTYRGASAQVQNAQKIDVNQQMNVKASFQSNMTLETDQVQTVQTGGGKTANVTIEVVADAEVEVEAQMEHNDVSTVAVPNMTCKETMAKLQSVLGGYKGEIDFSSNEEKMEIADGLVFIDGFHAVHFKIYTFTDEKTKATRWEFRRLQGTAMASGKFLGQIKAAFFAKDDQDENGDATALEALPLNTDDMKIQLSDEQKEMMMIHEALIADEVGIELDEAAENYLSAKLVEAGAISKDAAVDQQKLVKALMTEQVLNHKDVAVQRAALMMLAKFAKEQGKEMAAAGLPKMLETVSKGAKYGSITKRVEALSKLIQ